MVPTDLHCHVFDILKLGQVGASVNSIRHFRGYQAQIVQFSVVEVFVLDQESALILRCRAPDVVSVNDPWSGAIWSSVTEKDAGFTVK